jgi:hypothetical protein
MTTPAFSIVDMGLFNMHPPIANRDALVDGTPRSERRFPAMGPPFLTIRIEASFSLNLPTMR